MTTNKGFSIMELVIGMGLMALVSVVTASVMLLVNRTSTTMRKDMEASIDTTVAERVILGDLRQIAPSYNNILVNDDAGRGFFDYEPEVPSTTMTDEMKSRTATLSLSGRKTMEFIQQDTSAGEVLIYDPVAAYDVGAAPENFNQAASLTFRSLNNNNWIKKQRPQMWENGRLVFLDTPAKIRPIGANGVADMTVTPKSPIYLGAINGEDATTPKDAEAMLRRTHPLSGATIDSVDKFLRDLPSMGGGLPIVRVRGVRWVRYALEAMPQAADGARLMRTVYRNGQFGSAYMIAERLQSLQLTRKSINDRIIYFKLERVQ